LIRNSCTLLVVGVLSAWLGGCATVDFDYPKTDTRAFEDTDNTYLGQQIAPLRDAHPDESGFYLLIDGIEALAARVLMAKRAERSIDAQYYLITNDLIGYGFIGVLLEAADRGVRVRLLVDDIQTTGYDAGMAALDSHPNFEVRIFNPFAVRSSRGAANITQFSRVNRRMHNKSFTADNQVTLIGGRNIAAEYFAFRDDVNFGDVDVVAIGEVTRDVSRMFDSYWNHYAAAPVPAFAKMPEDPAAALEALRGRIDTAVGELKNTPYLEAFDDSMAKFVASDASAYTWAPYELVYDSPDKSDKDKAETAASIITPLAEAVKAAEKEVIIISPYFVPRQGGIEFLSGLSERGVDVTVITNSLAATNHAIVHSGYVPSRRPLLENGVRIFEVRPDASISGVERGGMSENRGGAGAAIATLHTKAFIVDRERIFIGSFNWDPRSAFINTELGVIIDSPEIAGFAADALYADADQNAYEVVLNDQNQIRWIDRAGDEEVVLSKEPQTGFWRRFSVGFYRMWPIKGQL